MKWILVVAAAGLRIPNRDLELWKQVAVMDFIQPHNSMGKHQAYEPLPRPFDGSDMPILSPGGKFKFNLKANVTKLEYSKMAEMLKVVATLLENFIMFTSPIIVNIDYLAPCIPFCERGGSAAWAISNRLEVKTKAHERVSVTTANLKQAGFRPKLQSPLTLKESWDINITYFTNHGMYLPQDYDQEIGNRDDAVYMLTHEILHGLGLGSMFNRYSFLGTVAPPLIQIDGKAPASYKFYFLMTNYDLNLVDAKQNKSIVEIYREIEKSGIFDNRSESEIYKTLKLSPHWGAFKSMNTLATTPNAIYFKTARGSKAYVETGLVDSPNSVSLTHLSAAAYNKSRHQLMIYNGKFTESIKRLLITDPSWNLAPLSQLSLEILETLGYELNPHPLPHLNLRTLYQTIDLDFKG